MDFILNSANLPFTCGLAIVAAFGLLEIFCNIIGFSLLEDHDADIDFDHHVDSDFGIHSSLVDWAGFGRIPLTAWFALLAGVFGIVGLTLNQISTQAFGLYLSLFISVPVAVIVSLPIVGFVSRFIAKIIPKDETSAVSVSSLVGREATVVYAPTASFKGQAFAFDAYGERHNFAILVLDTSITLKPNSKVHLDSLSDQGVFYVSPTI